MAKISEDSNRTVMDSVADGSYEELEASMDNEKLHDAIRKSFASLTKREEQVLRLRFGIDDVIDETHIYEVE